MDILPLCQFSARSRRCWLELGTMKSREGWLAPAVSLATTQAGASHPSRPFILMIALLLRDVDVSASDRALETIVFETIVFRAAPRPEVPAGSVAYGWAQSVETETGPMRPFPNRSRQLSRLRKS